MHGTTVKTRPAKNSFPFYERIVEVGATDGKHPIADTLLASIADTFFAQFGDCTTKDKACTVYGQNFQAADMHQINEYWKRIGKPSFQQRGWVVANTLTIFDRAYNKGQYGISAALYNLVTVEAVNEEANQALTAMGISPTVKDCKDKEKQGSHTAKMDAMCQRALRMIPPHLRTVVTKAHTLKYGNPTQKANLVLTREEWEEIKKNRAEMRSTATRDAWKRGCYDHIDYSIQDRRASTTAAHERGCYDHITEADRRASTTAAHERGCYDHVDCTDCANARSEKYDDIRFEWAAGAAASREQNRSY